jgi:NIMA (never in mitosis gene a)-related kinase 1/4/5
MIQMVHGLQALHDMSIVHRDIKSANIFLTKDGVVKLGDLNVSKVSKGCLLKTQTGTPYYASPEVWSDKPYDNKSDIWSLGCVWFEMCSLQPPFRGQDMNQLYKRVMEGRVSALPSVYSKDVASMVKACLQVKSVLRPSCTELLNKSTLLKNQPKKLKAEAPESQSELSLIDTIRLPRNLQQIKTRLPASNYEPRSARGAQEQQDRMVHRNLSLPPTIGEVIDQVDGIH